MPNDYDGNIMITKKEQNIKKKRNEMPSDYIMEISL